MNENIPVADTDTATATETLGGVEAVLPVADSPETAPLVATTPSKAARKHADAGKRDYTPRGTTYWARRVVLLNGETVGRGRPSKEGKGERKVVYVPVGMEYDVAVHGEGVKYNSHSHRATHKRIAKDSVTYTFDDGVAPTKIVKTKASKGKTAKATTKAKTGKIVKAKTGKPTKTAKVVKAKAAKKKSVTVAVADVVAPVEVTPAVEIPTDDTVIA